MSALRGRSTLIAAAFVGALAVCLTWSGFKELQADSFRLLYQGRFIAQHGIPHHDVFTLAAGSRPFADQQWLAELLSYEAWRLGGYAAVALLSALAFGAGYALLAALLRSRNASLAVTIASCTFAIFGALSLTFVRAQVLAIPLFVAVLWLCLDDARDGRLRARIVLVLPLLALWANVHGSVLIGSAVVACFLGVRAATSVWERSWAQAAAYAGLTAAAACAVFATPYGTHVLAYYRDMIGNHGVALADIEWDPPALGQFSFLQFVVPLLAAVGSVIAVIAKRRRVPWVLVSAVAITAVAAGTAMRNNLWLGIAAAVLVAETARVWLPTARLKPAFVGAIAVAAAVLAVVGVGRLATRSASGYQARVPMAAIAATTSYADTHPCARVLADNTSASALLWLDPSLAGRIGFDGELEAYPPSQLIDWVHFQAARTPHWLKAATGYQLLVGAQADQPLLVHRLGRLRHGRVLATDARGIAVVNRAAATAPCSATAHA
jgi:hypothetical protein